MEPCASARHTFSSSFEVNKSGSLAPHLPSFEPKIYPVVIFCESDKVEKEQHQCRLRADPSCIVV